MGSQRSLVDLDAEAGPARRVQHAVAELALDRGDRRGEEALGGEPVGEAGFARPVLAASVCGDLGRGGDPDRAVEGAGEVGGEDLGDLRSPPRARRPWRA